MLITALGELDSSTATEEAGMVPKNQQDNQPSQTKDKSGCRNGVVKEAPHGATRRDVVPAAPSGLDKNYRVDV
jgi:hypothetical protein